VVALMVAGLGLSGCGDDKTVTMPDGSKFSADSDGKSATISTDDGQVTAGKGLPDGFPAEDVPVVEGDIVGGAKGVDGGPYAWSVILKAKGETVDVFAELSEKLKNVGFTAARSMQMGSVSTGSFTNDKYEVSVNAAKVDDAVNVTYLVRNAP
jgi:hypothetical protein